MFNKMFALLLTIVCIDFTHAENNATNAPQQKLFTSNDPQQIELDKLTSAEQQLRHLTTEAPFFTNPVKGFGAALTGVAILAGASQIKDENTKNILVIAGFGTICIGSLYTVGSGMDNHFQRKRLQDYIYSRNLSKNSKI